MGANLRIILRVFFWAFTILIIATAALTWWFIYRPLPQTVHTPRFLLRSLGAEVNEWAKYLWHDSEGDRRYAFH